MGSFHCKFKARNVEKVWEQIEQEADLVYLEH